VARAEGSSGANSRKPASPMTIRSTSLSLVALPEASDPKTKATRIFSCYGSKAPRSTSARPVVFSTMPCNSPKRGDRRLA